MAAAEEVAADFGAALEDLQRNDKYEIMNLTVIARENTDHAQAIAKTLENHIKKTQPPRKLPALYLLDSIVKNVGSPYTVYFGKNLYSTFMEAYRSVDESTRRNMEAMLKTWREPVPNSTDPKPVFQIDVVSMIQTALQTARANATQGMQAQRPFHALPPRPPVSIGQQWRGPATPPTVDPRYAHPMSGYPPGTYGQGFVPHQPTPPANYYAPPPQPPMLQQQYPPMPQAPMPNLYAATPQPPVQDQYIVLQDIDQLTSYARDELRLNPLNPEAHGKVDALEKLSLIVRTQWQTLSPNDRQGIVIKVQQLKQAQSDQHAMQSILAPNPPTPQQSYQQIHQPPQQFDLAKALGQMQQARTATPPTLQHLAPPPGVSSAINPVVPPPSTNPQPQQPPSSADQLLATLRAAGLIPAQDTPQPARPGSSSLSALPFAPPPVSSSFPTPVVGLDAIARPPNSGSTSAVQLTSASLRQPHPDLIKTLYTSRSNQCSTCARRFDATPEGRSEKSNHMDFHFRVNRGMADAARRGISRSWYMGEREWISFREIDDAQEAPSNMPDTDGQTAGTSGDATKKANKTRHFIKAPSDAALAEKPCPICQERFQAVWNDTAQDWVWEDAMQIGGRVYHASCHEEVSKSSAIPRSRSPTSTPVLGKRKAEGVVLDHGGSRLKREVVA